MFFEEQEAGVWLTSTADVIPCSERWLHAPEQRVRLEAAMSWAAGHKASDADGDAVLENLAGQKSHGAYYGKQ